MPKTKEIQVGDSVILNQHSQCGVLLGTVLELDGSCLVVRFGDGDTRRIGAGRVHWVPSHEEIEKLSQAIRSSWSHEEQSRRFGVQPERVTAPAYGVSYQNRAPFFVGT